MEALNDWVARAQTGPLYLHCLFPRLYTAHYDTTVLDMNDTLGLLTTHMSRCRQLIVTAEDLISLPLLLNLIQNTAMPVLRSLSIFRVELHVWDRVRIHTAPVSLFSVGYPPLRKLRLSDLALLWDDLTHFTNLTTLVLHKFYSSRGPLWSDMRAALATSRLHLINLSIRDVECGPPSVVELDLVLLFPNLEEIDLEFHGHVNMALMVSKFVAPRLVVAHIGFETAADASMVVNCVALLREVTTFRAWGHSYGSTALLDLYRGLPNIHTLDLSEGHGLFLSFLDDRPSVNHVLCPKIRHLSVVEVSVSAVRLFMRRRYGFTSHISTLTLFYSFPYTHPTEYLKWLENNVDRLCVDPQGKSDLGSWLFC